LGDAAKIGLLEYKNALRWWNPYEKNGALALFSITALEKNPWAAIEVDCHAGKTRPVLAW